MAKKQAITYGKIHICTKLSNALLTVYDTPIFDEILNLGRKWVKTVKKRVKRGAQGGQKWQKV